MGNVLRGKRDVLRTVLMALVLLAWAGPSRGDGCAFLVAKPVAEMPGQQALIAHENGVQTLVIETRLVGEGADCAWVVPLPARPVVSEASTGVFPSLRAMCLPVIDRYSSAGPFLATLVLLGMALLFLGGWRGIAIVLALLLLVVATMLPALGVARSASMPMPGVSVVDRSVVGAFEVVTLDASAGDSLMKWLKENGFNVPPSAGPVVEAYIREGWCFVASKLHRAGGEPGGKEMTPHPLVFRFAAERPVYPMRLTGLQAGPLDLELYVFGAGTARVEGMTVETTGPLKREAVNGHWPRSDRQGIVLAHAGVEALAGNARHLTKLVGTFEPRQMQKDIGIEFGPGVVSGRRAMSRGDARELAIDVGLGVTAAGLIGAAIAIAVFKPRWTLGPEMNASRGRARVAAMMLALGCAAGVVTAAAGPRTVETERLRPYRMDWFGVINAVWKQADVAAAEQRPVTIDWVREEVKRQIESGEHSSAGRNERPWRPIEEDSPGNYTLREVKGGVVVVPVNELGQELDEQGIDFGVIQLSPR